MEVMNVKAMEPEIIEPEIIESETMEQEAVKQEAIKQETTEPKKTKKHKQKSLRSLLFKNTIAILIPTILVLVAVLGASRHYPIIYRMTNHKIEQLTDLDKWYGKRAYNVTVNPLQLKYTGYNYYEDERLTGAYYYSFMENTCVFFLIKTKNPEPVIENVTVRGKMLKDSATAEAMKNGFSQELGLDYNDFNTFVNPILISEPDYPYLEIILMWIVLILPSFGACAIIASSIVWTIRPERHPATRQLSEIGDRRLVYEEVQSQFKNRMLQHNYNYYVTEDYLIISHWMTTDFIRIDFIRYISKHVIQKMHGKRQVYRLTMSNPEKMFYERDFHSESCADEIMATLIRLNPEIDNRTMKVFDLEEISAAKEEPTAEPEEAASKSKARSAEQETTEKPEAKAVQPEEADTETESKSEASSAEQETTEKPEAKESQPEGIK